MKITQNNDSYHFDGLYVYFFQYMYIYLYTNAYIFIKRDCIIPKLFSV